MHPTILKEINKNEKKHILKFLNLSLYLILYFKNFTLDFYIFYITFIISYLEKD